MDKAAYLQSELVQDAVIRNFEIIGEASHNISLNYPDFATTYSDLPLAFAYQMRNAIAHGYFKVDHEIVWKTAQGDLSSLQTQIESALKALPPSAGGDAV